MDSESSAPTFLHERSVWDRGFHNVAGIDEAGRGALAGPVVAAAVVPPVYATETGIWSLVRDSKLLSAGQRADYAAAIRTAALAWGVGVESPAVIDRIGIAAATRRAMRGALEALAVHPDYLLIDWVRLPEVNIEQESLVKADRHLVSVAAASILAKDHRDRLLVELGRTFPAYGFEQHKGYGTPGHLRAIEQQGACSQHRHSFGPIARQASLGTATD